MSKNQTKTNFPHLLIATPTFDEFADLVQSKSLEVDVKAGYYLLSDGNEVACYESESFTNDKTFRKLPFVPEAFMHA